MIKIVCNRCGKDITGNTGYIAWIFKDRSSGNIVNENIFTGYDYCEECMEKIREFITHEETILHHQTAAVIAAAPPDAETDPTTSIPEAAGQDKDNKKGKRNSQIDLGKVNALRKAGWSIGKIAEEMAVDPDEIATAIYIQKRQESKAART